MPASARSHDGRRSISAPLLRGATRTALNVLRSVPELVWAALLLISAGLGPFAGTFAGQSRRLNARFAYNRRFEVTRDRHAGGSWTRRLHPDYTLTFWPEDLSEAEAERQGSAPRNAMVIETTNNIELLPSVRKVATSMISCPNCT